VLTLLSARLQSKFRGGSGGPGLESVFDQVCGNFAVHSRTTVTFSGTSTTLDGGDVGVSPVAKTAITGIYLFDDAGAIADATANALPPPLRPILFL
jgi:hypothetical protein